MFSLLIGSSQLSQPIRSIFNSNIGKNMVWYLISFFENTQLCSSIHNNISFFLFALIFLYYIWSCVTSLDAWYMHFRFYEMISRIFFFIHAHSISKYFLNDVQNESEISIQFFPNHSKTYPWKKDLPIYFPLNFSLKSTFLSRQKFQCKKKL